MEPKAVRQQGHPTCTWQSSRPAAQREPSRRRPWLVRNESYYQCHDGGIESTVGKGKFLGIAQLKFCEFRSGPCACIRELLFRWVYRYYFRRSRAADNPLRKCSVATTDVEPSQAPWSV